MASTLAWCKAREPDAAAAQARFDEYWRSDGTDVYHFIGKDIVYFHALFWPAMLMGSGFRTPTQLCVHGFLTINGEKMSKSRGTFITAETYARHLDPQHLRYYFASKMSSRVEDIDLNFDDFTQRVNADLVGKLANIPSRVLAILHKSGGGRLGRLDDRGRALVQLVRDQCDRVGELYEARELGQLTRIVADLAGEVNRYLQEREPWQLAKDGKIAEAVTVCTGALNAFRLLATLVQPILPRLGAATARVLELPALTWAGLDELLEDRPVRPYERLAERVDKAKVKAVLEESLPSLAAEQQVEAPRLSLDPLLDVELRALRVAGAEPVANSDHLVALSLDDGGQARPVVAGIGHDAGPQLVGKDVLVLANLEPKKLKGRESRGMLLAAKTEAGAIPVVVPAEQGGRRVG
jgi:methionyl-tRNA synthetase